jgi:rhomboid-like protein
VLKANLSQLVGSHFSHASLMHLGFNTMALWSFGVPMANAFGSEQFLAFSVGAGMSAGLLSQLHSVFTKSATPGLGASGVIMGLVGAFALTHQDAVIYVPFLPFIQGPAIAAFGLLMAVDVVGLALGWKVLGHAAHLGGQLFGVAYLFGGQSVLFTAPVNAFTELRIRAGW